jgi:hypothetical protein
MIHSEVFEKLFAVSLPRAPNPHGVDRALQERAPRKQFAFSKGLAFGKGGDGFAVQILGHGLSLQKDVQGDPSPVVFLARPVFCFRSFCGEAMDIWNRSIARGSVIREVLGQNDD